MLKLITPLTYILACLTMFQTTTMAWEQHSLPVAFTDSSTAHYGGNKAPLVLSNTHIQVATAQGAGVQLWTSNHDGITWQATQLSNNTAFTHTYLASPSLVLSWGKTQPPTMFYQNISSGSWSAASPTWPLTNWHIIDVNTSTTGDIIVLATTPEQEKLVEGELFILRGNLQGWSKPVHLSQPTTLVGDASIVVHSSGLESVVWSERNGNAWRILSRNSSDGYTWSSPLTIVESIAAPYFQEAAVQIDADSLNQEEIALAYTGWMMQAHSQVWSKAFDAISGQTTQASSLLPDAGDMVHQPSLVTLADNTWAVAWQQKIGIDSEIYIAQHHAGTWSDAVNVSADPNHMDRDPHIAKGLSKTLNIAFTRRMQADIQEVYMFAEGDINDSSLDSDGDGIPNTQEQGFDLDNDGIDDAHSARVATWLAEDGRYALIVQGNGELRQVQSPSLHNTNIKLPDSHQASSALFVFQIDALNHGETTQVHVLTPNHLDEHTTWLKLHTHVYESHNAYHTVAPDDTGRGLIISLTDGGANDKNGISNGIVVDPAVLATPKTTIPDSTTSHLGSTSATQAEGACLAPTSHNPWVVVMLMGLIVLISYLQSKH